jgi:hypothetical protein
MILFKDFFSKTQPLKENYSAVVLDNNSHERLVNDPQIVKYLNPKHEIIAHHMTIKMGSLGKSKHVNRLGKTETLIATHIGMTNDGNAIAVRVDGLSDNQIPHVTLSINTNSNAKPKDSNKITKWIPLKNPIKLTGTVQVLSL